MEIDGVIAGYAYASEHRARKAYQWSVDVSVYIGEQFRSQGIGKILYQELFTVLKAQGYINAFAGISLPNEASIRLHEATGFKPIGIYRSVGYKLGNWCDVGWWQLELQAPPQAPNTPIPFSTVFNQLNLYSLK